VQPVRATLALVVALGMVIGVNYANDYSDGIRGTDTDRVGPLRLVGSGVAAASTVRLAAVASLSVAALAGLALVSLTQQWWLLAVGAACLLGAWFYTGGRRPYGYVGLGELAVFVFFGPVAVLGTVYVQGIPPSALSVLAAIGVGLLACAVLVANNLRDIGTDGAAGKHTLAVRLGAHDTQRLYAALVVLPFVVTIIAGLRSPTVLLGLLAIPLAVSPVRRVLSGVTGRRLVSVLRQTGILLLGWSALTAVGLGLSQLTSFRLF
jgi:1,4-dihydroxy-2-naphthoate octaprenyltransferase